MSIPLTTARDHAYKIMKPITGVVGRWQTVGEIRRGESEVDQIDIVLIVSVRRQMEMQILLGSTARELSKYLNRFVIKSKFDEIVIIHLATEDNFAFQTLFKTGPKPFLNAIQKIAKSKGIILNEHEMFNVSRKYRIEDEGAIFGILGIEYIKPEQRAAITKLEQLI